MLLRLGNAAIDLFEARGPDVTIDEIAAAAGVSRRTVFRWCDGKEQLAFVHPMLWLDVFEDALAVADPSWPTGRRLGEASLAIARHIDADPDAPRRAFLVAVGHPELLRGFHATFQQWIDRVAVEAESAGATSFEARVIGSCVMGMVDATTRQWLLEPDGGSYEQLLETGLAHIQPLLDKLPS